MKRLALTVLAGLPLLAACTTTSGPAYRQQVAWNRCANSPGPDARAACIKTQVALMEADADREEKSAKAAKIAAEEKQAQREALGVPTGKSQVANDTPQ